LRQLQLQSLVQAVDLDLQVDHWKHSLELGQINPFQATLVALLHLTAVVEHRQAH
jgi:hypothetical protein